MCNLLRLLIVAVLLCACSSSYESTNESPEALAKEEQALMCPASLGAPGADCVYIQAWTSTGNQPNCGPFAGEPGTGSLDGLVFPTWAQVANIPHPVVTVFGPYGPACSVIDSPITIEGIGGPPSLFKWLFSHVSRCTINGNTYRQTWTKGNVAVGQNTVNGALKIQRLNALANPVCTNTFNTQFTR